jgi:hypothetical protein
MLVKFILQPVSEREAASAESLRALSDAVGSLRERVDDQARELERLKGGSPEA